MLEKITNFRKDRLKDIFSKISRHIVSRKMYTSKINTTDIKILH